MAVTRINPVQRPVQVVGPPREDNMDKLLKALQITQAGLGIAVNFDTFMNSDELREAQIAKAKASERQSEEAILASQAERARQPTPEQAQAVREADVAGRRAATRAQEVETGRRELAAPLERKQMEAETGRIQAQTRLADAQAKSVADKKVKQKEMSQSQAKAHLFGNRIEQAESVFQDLDDRGYNRASLVSAAQTYLPGVARSSESLMQEQAERNFVNAVLRRESGAVISESEFENAEKQYFPRFGDSAEVIAQKNENRQIVLDNFVKEAGPNFESIGQIQTKEQNQQLLKQIKAADPDLTEEEALRVFDELIGSGRQ
jgi:hypothetical protein